MSGHYRELLLSLHATLCKHYGPLNWWPADTPFEVAVGAILTQNTAWKNVESAISNLKKANRLSPTGIAETDTQTLETLIMPSGFYRQKARRLQLFTRQLLKSWQGDIELLCNGPLNETRKRLLSFTGIGPETADAILLYAANRPSFVVDAYTRRVFQRVGLLHGKERYDGIRNIFMRELPEDVALYNEYHAQIVNLAKDFCTKRQPHCDSCPIKKCCGYAKERSNQTKKNVSLPE